MKKMIFLLLISTSCNSQTDAKFNSKLDNCMSEHDLVEFEIAVNYFDEQLKKRYESTDLNNAYLMHLEDFYAKKYDESRFDFFMNKEALAIIERLKDSKTFDKIWISLSTAVSEIRDENGNPILNDPDNEKLVIINKYGDYQKCVKASTNNPAIIEYIDFEIESVGMSFLISAKHLRENLNPKDFNDDLNKLVVALGFYYEYIFMTNSYYGNK